MTLTTKIIRSTVLVFIFSSSVLAQSWTNVGFAGFTGTSYYNKMAVDKNDVPYIAYLDFNAGLKVSVMKYDGTSWTYVGTPGFSTMASTCSFVMHQTTPYVIFGDATGTNDVTVMKYTGTSWINVGNAAFSVTGASDPDIAVDGTGTPYALYNDRATPSWKATVKKFNGTSWVTVGTAGFSAGQSMNNHIKFDKTGTPYVVYQDGGTNNKITVMKFDGTNWVNVGAPGFSTNAISHCNIAFSSTNEPYVVYNEFNGTVDKVIVKSFNGTSWVNIGPTLQSTTVTWFNYYYSNIALDLNNTPYVSYIDNYNGERATAMKFNGTSWLALGSSPFTASKATYLSMAMDSQGKLYAAFQDGNTQTKSTVKTYSTVTGLNDSFVSADKRLSVYPNPASEIVNLNIENPENKNIEIAVINSLGQLMHFEKTTGSYFTINTKELPAGVYFVKVNIDNGTITQKLLVGQK